ncbi:MAG: hypothetical protein WBX15_03255 [Thermoanaerobaculia bacterium]
MENEINAGSAGVDLVQLRAGVEVNCGGAPPSPKKKKRRRRRKIGTAVETRISAPTAERGSEPGCSTAALPVPDAKARNAAPRDEPGEVRRE